MGTPDDVWPYGAIARRLVCRAGHAIASFQTHDLEDACLHYYLVGGRLYELPRDGKLGPPRLERGRLVVPVERIAHAYVPSGPVSVLAFCYRCREVFAIRSVGRHRRFTTWNPVVEYELCFVAGKLRRIVPKQVESSDDVRKRLRGEGWTIVSRRHPKAVAHLRECARWEAPLPKRRYIRPKRGRWSRL